MSETNEKTVSILGGDMAEHTLILGASGTAGAAVFRQLSRCGDWKITGTYCSAKPADASSMLRFSLEPPDGICRVLEAVRPDLVVSALRGDFEKQLAAHAQIAAYLRANRGKIIYLSTVNVFDALWERPHFETDARASGSAYGQFKIQCEDLLRNRLGSRAVILRLPFVWGKHSPRMQAVRAGCEAGQLEVYAGFSSNHAADAQIAGWVQWIIQEDKEGIFHVGTSDVVPYQAFLERLAAAAGLKQPQWIPRESPGVAAVLSSRTDLPDSLKWDSGRLVQYLCC